jgi:hypothetical protein
MPRTDDRMKHALAGFPIKYFFVRKRGLNLALPVLQVAMQPLERGYAAAAGSSCRKLAGR